MSNYVKVDEDAFIEMCWERVNDFRPAQAYDDDFWAEVFAYLQDISWFKDVSKNLPSYIVDNVAVNGDICKKDECIDNYDAINKKYDGDVDEWIDDNGYIQFGDYVVLNLGL